MFDYESNRWWAVLLGIVQFLSKYKFIQLIGYRSVNKLQFFSMGDVSTACFSKMLQVTYSLK